MEGSEQRAILVRHVPAPGTLAAGQKSVARCTDEAVLLVSTVAGAPVIVVPEVPSSFDSIGAGLADSGVINDAPATLLDVNGYNAANVTRFFQLYNAAVIPPDTEVPATIPIEIPRETHFFITFADSMGRFFSVGISWASSTTQLTKTITGAPDMIINAQFRV